MEKKRAKDDNHSMSESVPPPGQQDLFEALNMRTDHLIEKGVGLMNEDAILLGTNRFGIFDGATSLDGYVDEEGRTGGYLAANIAKEVFEKSTPNLRDATGEANESIAAAMSEKGVLVEHRENLWSTACAVVDIDRTKKKFDWVQISDAIILLIYKDGSHKLVVPDYDHDTDLLSKWKEFADRGTPNIWPEMLPDIIENRRQMNVTYGKLSGEPAAMNFLKYGQESLENVRHLLLFTDGLILPLRDPKMADDFSTLTSLFLEGGLARIRDYVRKIESSDPDCRAYPRFKKSDDIAAIAISFDQ